MESGLLSPVPNKWYVYCLDLCVLKHGKQFIFNKNGDEEGMG